MQERAFGRALKRSQSFFCVSCANTNGDRTRIFFRHRRIALIFFVCIGINRLVFQKAYMRFTFGSTFVIILFPKQIKLL